MKLQTQETLYNQDCSLWFETKIGKLRDYEFQSVDIENLIEELETLGGSEKKAFRSYLKLIVMHLLKWQYKAEKRSKSWEITIRNNVSPEYFGEGVIGASMNNQRN
ncbi:DUF29 domain-containing protein [Trichormus azollae]|jgi:hypothetical protein|uniref:DUF29 domain-containing protein n=1 Tax=Nostoc azollae (strain 0708) TaxID=551115 RepID=D7DVR4_NOSA0|nr:DUF29 domain-containing protein [Trichormus azollae]ADI63923.1 protein of unknown function DUF29 ['Nostoc azollae' 0708]